MSDEELVSSEPVEVSGDAPEIDDSSNDEAAQAAFEAALDGESAETASGDKPKKAEEKADKPPTKSIMEKLRARTAEHKAREAARQELEAERQKFLKEQSEIERHKSELKKQSEFLEQLRKNPAAAVRAIGMEPEKFIMDLANDGTPESQAEKRFAELAQQQQELRSLIEQAQKAEQEAIQKSQQAAVQAHVRQAEQKFVELTQKSFPTLHTRFSDHPDLLVKWGNDVAEYIHAATGKERVPHEDVAEFLQELFGGSNNQASQGLPKSNAPKRLSSLNGRASIDKADGEGDEERRLRKAEEVFAAALRNDR